MLLSQQSAIAMVSAVYHHYCLSILPSFMLATTAIEMGKGNTNAVCLKHSCKIGKLDLLCAVNIVTILRISTFTIIRWSVGLIYIICITVPMYSRQRLRQ